MYRVKYYLFLVDDELKKQELVLNLDDKTFRSSNFFFVQVHETCPRPDKITEPPLS